MIELSLKRREAVIENRTTLSLTLSLSSLAIALAKSVRPNELGKDVHNDRRFGRGRGRRRSSAASDAVLLRSSDVPVASPQRSNSDDGDLQRGDQGLALSAGHSLQDSDPPRRPVRDSRGRADADQPLGLLGSDGARQRGAGKEIDIRNENEQVVQ